MSTKSTTMSGALGELLDELCVEWGFCIPQSEAEKVKSVTFLDADDFANRVLVAEGMNPEYEIQWHRKIKGKFVERFGQELQDNDF